MSDRITRQQLKEDPLLKTTGETVDYVQHHMRMIVGLTVALVVVVAAVLVVRSSAARGEERAAGLLAEARGNMIRGVLEPAAAGLNTVIQAHKGTEAAREARVLMGTLRYNQGRYNEAEEHYREAVRIYADDPILGQVARRGLAACLENVARYEEAAAVFAEIVKASPPSDLRADMQLAQARNLLKSGRTEEAEAVYREVSLDEAHPMAAQTAKQRLAELTAVPVARAAG